MSICRCSRRSATSRSRSTRTGRRSSRTAVASPNASTSTAMPASRPEVTEVRWDEATRAGSIRTNRGDAHAGAFRRAWRTAPLQPAQAAGHPRHRRLPAATPSTPAAGTTSTPAATRTAGCTSLPDKRVGHHRHRRDRGAVRPASGRSGPSSSTSSSARLRRSTCAATGRPIRTGRAPRARLAAATGMDNFQIFTAGGFAEEDLVERRLDRRSSASSSASAGQATPTAMTPEELAAALETRRLREDGADPRARGRDRRGPGDRRGAEALSTASSASDPASTTSTCATFNRPNVTLVDTHGQGVERITEHGVVVDGTEYELDCLIYRDRLRGRHRLHPARRLRAHRPRRADPRPRSGPRACAPCTACTCTASPTAS